MEDTPAQKILSRLDRVKRRPTPPKISGVPCHAAWWAKCPAHPDTNPSLSVLERTDGSISIRCWVGCTLDQILSAKGLRRADLFPRPAVEYEGSTSHLPVRPRVPVRELLTNLTTSLRVISGAASDILEGGELSTDALRQLHESAAEVAELIEDANE